MGVLKTLPAFFGVTHLRVPSFSYLLLIDAGYERNLLLVDYLHEKKLYGRRHVQSKPVEGQQGLVLYMFIDSDVYSCHVGSIYIVRTGVKYDFCKGKCTPRGGIRKSPGAWCTGGVFVKGSGHPLSFEAGLTPDFYVQVSFCLWIKDDQERVCDSCTFKHAKVEEDIG